MGDERRKLIQHKGKTLIFHDYTNLYGDEYVAVIERNAKKADETELSERLVLLDVTDSLVNKRVIATFKRVSKGASTKVSKIAVVGVTTIQRAFVQAIAKFSGTNMKAFETHEQAKDWLTS